MADFVGNHIGLRKFTRRAKTAPQFPEKSQVEIHLFIPRAIKGTNRLTRHTASGRISIPEKHHFGVTVRHAFRLRQGSAPGPLHIVQNE